MSFNFQREVSFASNRACREYKSNTPSEDQTARGIWKVMEKAAKSLRQLSETFVAMNLRSIWQWLIQETMMSSSWRYFYPSNPSTLFFYCLEMRH